MQDCTLPHGAYAKRKKEKGRDDKPETRANRKKRKLRFVYRAGARAAVCCASIGPQYPIRDWTSGKRNPSELTRCGTFLEVTGARGARRSARHLRCAQKLSGAARAVATAAGSPLTDE